MAGDNGLARLLARYDRLPKKVRAAAIPSLDKSADEIMDTARRLVRVDTGATKASIRKEAGRHELEIVVRAGGAATTKAARAGHGSYDYAIGEEFGTMATPASPFFFPAVRINRKSARARTKRAISKAIKEG